MCFHGSMWHCKITNNVMCISEMFEILKSTIERRKSVAIYVIHVDKMWVFLVKTTGDVELQMMILDKLVHLLMSCL